MEVGGKSFCLQLKLNCYQHKIDCYIYRTLCATLMCKPHGKHKAKTYSRFTKAENGFSVVNKAETVKRADVDVFLEFCFFYDPTDVGSLIFGFFAFSIHNGKEYKI